jgi:hypothetical protein
MALLHIIIPTQILSGPYHLCPPLYFLARPLRKPLSQETGERFTNTVPSLHPSNLDTPTHRQNNPKVPHKGCHPDTPRQRL